MDKFFEYLSTNQIAFTVLGILLTLFISLISLYFNLKSNKAVRYLDSVTKNRVEWIDKLRSSKAENPFWIACKNYSPIVQVNGQSMTIREMVDKEFEIDVTKQNIDFLYNTLGSLSREFSFYVREQVFEEYRKINYPNLPSRQKCLWVTEAEQLSYWKTMEQDKLRSLLTLELDGELFCADERWLVANTFSSVVYLERAKHYWAGEMTSSPIKEYLFCGTATIKEIQHFT